MKKDFMLVALLLTLFNQWFNFIPKNCIDNNGIVKISHFM